MIIEKVMKDYFDNAGYDLGYIDGLKKALELNDVTYHLQGITTGKDGLTTYSFKCWPDDDEITRINLVMDDDILEDYYIS